MGLSSAARRSLVEVKMMANFSWRNDIVDRYPKFFTQQVRGRACRPGRPTVGDGWQDLVERAIRRIAAAAPLGGVTIEQVTEKYGTLRLNCRGTTAMGPNARAAIEEAVALAEARSACTCEKCGQEGALYSAGSWLITACPEHARGEAVPVKPGHDNLHIVRSWPDLVISCRRYVREPDVFVDVDPRVLGDED
jgi:hypothetical protein